MVTLRSAVAALFGAAALLSDSALAHSVKRNPLSYVSVVRDGSIHAPAHRVHSHSNFDLTFSLHDGRERVRLALHPNHDVIHDDFTVTFLDPHGNVKSSEQVDRALHRVYKGDAFIERPGEIGWSKAGWARITVHRDGIHPVFDGVYRIDGDHHHIQTGARYNQLKHDFDPVLPPNDGDLGDDETMVVWRDSDVDDYAHAHAGTGELKARQLFPPGDALCTSDSLSFNAKYDAHLLAHDNTAAGRGALQGMMSARSLFGRQSIDGTGGSSLGGGGNNLINSIGKPDGCPTSRKVALVGIATDCTYWQGFNSSEDLRKYVIGMVNQASQVYESTFKISLGIKNLTVLDKNCPGTPAAITPWNVPCGSSTTITDRLNLFSAWRGRTEDTNAYWSLLTSCPTDSAVGLAWRGQLCRPSAGTSSDGMGNNETVAAVNVVVKTPTEWQVFAHETGHTFGAIHDCTPDLCPVDPSNPVCCPLSATQCDAGGQYIMNPSTSSGITNFSPCSLGNICSSLKLASMSSCLTDNKNVETITGSQCGNGIVEPGEECDCGGDQNCASNPCCNAETCQLKSGAVCDPSNEDCCTDKCQFSSTDVVCRASTGECDVQETCPGDAAKCPDDGHKDDGDPCGGGGGGLKCASGQCTSRDRQCQVISGSSIVNNATKSCPQTSGSCQLSCAVSHSNAFGVGQCLVYGQNFIDGTPCGGGGHCLNGDCKGSSTVKEIKNWIDSHKHIVIPVAAVLGALLLLVIGSCLLNCCRRARNNRKPKYVPPVPPPGPSGWQPNAWRSVPPPTQPQHSPPPPRQQQQQPGYESSYYPPQGPPPMYMHHNQVPVDEDGWQRPPRYA
ncbi:Disintegrin and metalloproteinase domain-containing protein B [Escovopsis weberi]|uniref:Disintegrin and metalloproteinase domain-containing protein B n=1 Tax=Escovopsis weberi TaxID=150374 RepID=A0A0M9VXA1_ESCWE|nr:Disintegrin and metalloproteinase domain-containing protein B [Escovopsis weberi]